MHKEITAVRVYINQDSKKNSNENDRADGTQECKKNENKDTKTNNNTRTEQHNTDNQKESKQSNGEIRLDSLDAILTNLEAGKINKIQALEAMGKGFKIDV